MGKRLKKALIGVAALVALALGGAALAQGSGSGGGEEDETISGPRAGKATAAALKITNGGRANSVELDGENGATWEVEVTKPDGNTVDVRLDENYDRVVVEGDSEDESR